MNLLDRAISYVSPRAGLGRVRSRAIMTMIDTAHAGASITKRSLRGWGVRDSSNPDDEVLPELQTLRDRSRDLYKNNSIGGGAIRTVVTNVVGSGLRLQSRIDRQYLLEVAGLSDAQADALEDRIERFFHAWAAYTDADAGRRLNFYELQELAFLTYLMAGECFTILPIVPRPGTVSNLRVQLIDADRVSNPDGQIDFGALMSGIEVGKYGEPLAYYIETTPPGNIARTWQKVAAYGAKSGRVNVLHLYRQERPGQRRGVPYLTPVIEPLKQIGRYTDSELMAAVVSSMFTVFIKSPATDNDILGAALPDSDQQETEPQHYEMAPGAIVGLGDGEEPVFANPGRPNAAFDPFVTALLRQVGMALEIPYEVLVRHFQSSYSAARGALMEAWKFFRARRQWLSEKWAQPIYEEWLTDMVLNGVIDAPGFFDSTLIRRAYCGAEWIGPAPTQLDPTKEVAAARDRVTFGFSTKSAETMALTGADWTATIRQRAKEEATEKALGLNIPEATSVSETVVETNSGDENG